jgi:hypothetical protein
LHLHNPAAYLINWSVSLLGITFGLFTVFNDNIPNLVTIEFYQALFLFGIGMGVGSLKELVDKDSDSGCKCIELPQDQKNPKNEG